jgi:DNA helicase-2/ATP-dependent DNA helicase PcrA
LAGPSAGWARGGRGRRSGGEGWWQGASGRGRGPVARGEVGTAAFVPDEQPDYDEGGDLAPRFMRGERVLHPRFGSGTIRRVTGFGRDLRVIVEFDDEGEKTLVARLARLEREV